LNLDDADDNELESFGMMCIYGGGLFGSFL